MKRKRSSQQERPADCREIHPEDGIDPSELFRPRRKFDPHQRKAQQLCHQVADTLNLVLSGEFGDELRDLRVVAVRPAPDASQLLVLVAPAISGSPADPEAIIAKLTAAAGRLRSEVAMAITRRRAPKLMFQFIAGDSATELHR
ncbi:MAG TPA: hypothetical protein VFE24_18165 [Pirellulales bacterium]|jgi:ribosome-binding factor A|nr:hypothetical protein [Pirellulales bacterium]